MDLTGLFAGHTITAFSSDRALPLHFTPDEGRMLQLTSNLGVL